MENKGIICYDVNICPQCIEMDRIVDICKNTDYLIYDSFEAIRLGSPRPYPYMLDSKEEMTKILVDISTEEGKKIYEEIISRLNDNNNS